jgi:hypothetical protein
MKLVAASVSTFAEFEVIVTLVANSNHMPTCGGGRV